MTVVVITPPAAQPVTLAQAKANMRIDHSEEDGFIGSLIEAVSASLDGPDGVLGRALITQTLELRLSAFPTAGGLCDADRAWRGTAPAAWRSDRQFEVPLPFPPIASIASIDYFDNAGADQTLDPATYQIVGSGGRTHLALAHDHAWPDSPWRREGLRIRYLAGYGTAPAAVPAPIRHAILLQVAHLYANRESVTTERGGGVELPQSALALLGPYRILSL